MRPAARLLLAAALASAPGCAADPGFAPVDRGDGPVAAALHEEADNVFSLDLWVGSEGRPARFLLDTGAALTVLSPDIASGVDPSGAARDVEVGGVASSRSRESFHGRVLLSLRREGGWLWDFPGVEYWGLPVPHGLDGIAGLHTFPGHLVAVDLGRRSLELLPGSLPPADGRRCLDLRVERGIPFAAVEVAGVPLEAAVDTGFFGALYLPPATAAGLPLEPPRAGGRRHVRDVHGDHPVEERVLRGEIRLAGVALRDPVVLVGEGDPLLGAAFLRRFRVTFDLASGRALFEPSGR